MATSASSASSRDESLQEQEKLYNFLKKYDLQIYYSKFVRSGVRRLSHLKSVAGDEESLSEIGLTKFERIRLKIKIKENFSWKGKVVKKIVGKKNQFDSPAPELSRLTVEKEGRRAAAIIPKEEIKQIRKIGEGAHGAVFEGTWADEHGSVAVAVKILIKRQESQELVIKEANAMSTLNHKHIVQLYGIVLSEPLMLVEELAPFGSLLDYVKKEGSRCSLKLFHSYVVQIADAMAYLEERRIVHRDLAIRNILLAHVDLIKLSDFGMARTLDKSSDVYMLSNMTARIPVAWTPLEALTHATFSTASDVWSYGVCIWEIYSLGKVPWAGLDPILIMDKLAAGDRLGRPERCPVDVFQVVEECWAANPPERPSFAHLLKEIKLIPPRQVRATIAYTDHSDPNHLTFKNGELIYVIDRPMTDWLYGMKTNCTCGLVSSSHVSGVTNLLDDIKTKVTSGEMNVSDIAIGSPTEVELMVHITKDGSKWISDSAQESDVKWTPPVTPPMARVLDVRSPSPGQAVPTSPLTNSTASSSTTEPRLQGHSFHPASYLSPTSMRPPASPITHSNNDPEAVDDRDNNFSDAPGDTHLDFIMDLGGETDDLVGIDRPFTSNLAPTLDDQYVSMRRTVDPSAFDPAHNALDPAHSAQNLDVTASDDVFEVTSPLEEPLPSSGRSQSGSTVDEVKCAPYVCMQSVRMKEGAMEDSLLGASMSSLTSAMSSAAKPVAKKRRSTTVFPSAATPPQPLPRTRPRNNTTSDVPDNVVTDRPPAVPPRISYTAVSFANPPSDSPSVPPRRHPVSKTRLNGSLSRSKDSLSSVPQDSENNKSCDIDQTSPAPPLPPTPRARMREDYQEHLQDLSQDLPSDTTPPRRNSTGPVSSMFNASFVKNIVGGSSPSFTHRERHPAVGVGDRSSVEVEGKDGAISPFSLVSSSDDVSPDKESGEASRHYDIPRSWTSGGKVRGNSSASNYQEPSTLPLPPSSSASTIAPPLRKPKQHYSLSQTTSSPLPSSPSSPAKERNRISFTIPENPEEDEPVIPRRVRVFSNSPSISPYRSSSGGRPRSVTTPAESLEGQLTAINPKYSEVASSAAKEENSPNSTPDNSPSADRRYATIPRDSSSSSTWSSATPQYTVLSAVRTLWTSSSDEASASTSTVTYQPIQLMSMDKPHDYQTLDEFTSQDNSPPLLSRGGEEVKSKDAVGYQPIPVSSRSTHVEYTVLDPHSRKELPKSPIPERKAFATAPRPAKPRARAKEDIKVDIDKTRRDMKLKVIQNDQEFSDCDPEILEFALSHEKYDVNHAKHYIRVQQLLGMLLPNITEDDCSKALLHCQQNMDRAAMWLMEKSQTIQQDAH